jgi:hypothetical protein
MDNEKLFYCYSTRMNYFLMSMKFSYVSVGTHKETNKKYWTYYKSENLDSAINKYNSIKHNFSWKIKIVERN